MGQALPSVVPIRTSIDIDQEMLWDQGDATLQHSTGGARSEAENNYRETKQIKNSPPISLDKKCGRISAIRDQIGYLHCAGCVTKTGE